MKDEVIEHLIIGGWSQIKQCGMNLTVLAVANNLFTLFQFN